MINVTIYRLDDQITAFEIAGHAESGPYGYDLVCAAVSAITFGAVNAIIQLCDMELKINQENEGGYLHVQLPDSIKNVAMEKAQILLKGMLISLETIERDYGKFILIRSK